MRGKAEAGRGGGRRGSPPVGALMCLLFCEPSSALERKVYAEFCLQMFRSDCIPLSGHCELISHYSQDTKI